MAIKYILVSCSAFLSIFNSLRKELYDLYYTIPVFGPYSAAQALLNGYSVYTYAFFPRATLSTSS